MNDPTEFEDVDTRAGRLFDPPKAARRRRMVCARCGVTVEAHEFGSSGEYRHPELWVDGSFSKCANAGRVFYPGDWDLTPAKLKMKRLRSTSRPPCAP